MKKDYFELLERQRKNKKLPKSLRNAINSVISAYKKLDTSVYIYCIERKTITGETYYEPVASNDGQQTFILANTDIIELQTDYKEDIEFLRKSNIPSLILQVPFKTYWELNLSIVDSETIDDKFGSSLIIHIDDVRKIKSNDSKETSYERIHTLTHSNFHNVCIKNLDKKLKIIERKLYVPFVVELN